MIYWNLIELNKNNGVFMKKTKNALFAIACAMLVSLSPAASAEECRDPCCEWGNYSSAFIGPFGNSVRIRRGSDGDHRGSGERGRRNKRRSATGSLWGVYGGYEYKKPCGIYAGLIGYWGGGSISGHRDRHDRRDGSGSGRRRHHDRRSSDYQDGQIEARLGYSFNLGWDCENEWQVTPYVGFGYTNLRFKRFGQNQDQDGSGSGSGRNRNHLSVREYYVPVGFLSKYVYNDTFTIGLNFKWMPQVDSTLKPRSRGRSGILFDLSNKSNFNVELPICMTLGCENEFGVSFVPFWNYIQIGKSRRFCVGSNRVRSPDLQITYWGARILGEYKF
jgi:Outer membrane protein beta-barrel domain